MTDYEKEYINVLESIKKSNDKINTIENTDIFRLYKLFVNERKLLEEKKDNLYKKMMFEKFDKCHHFAVKSRFIYYGWGEKGTTCHGCIKCGLDNSVLQDVMLNDDMLIMKAYFEKCNVYDFAKVYNIVLNLEDDEEISYINGYEQAKQFYRDVIKQNPNISNKELEELLKVELNKMEEAKSGHSRKREGR